MSDILIRSGDDLRKLLATLTEARPVGERGYQDDLAFDLEQLRARFPNESDLDEDAEELPVPSPAKKKTPKKKKPEVRSEPPSDDGHDMHGDESDDTGVIQITARDIMDHLNIIRSGMSLKRGDIKDAMEEYFDALSDAERLALDSFLEGIASIVTGGQEHGDEAKRPEPTVDLDTEVRVDTSRSHTDSVEDPEEKRAAAEIMDEPEDRELHPKRKQKKKKKRRGLEDTSPPISVSR